MVRDEEGKERSLSEVLGKESILLPGYFGCEHLCHFTMKNLASKMARFRHHPKIVFLSINAEDTPRDAVILKKQIKGPERKYWTFLTAGGKTIRAITKELDFSWKPDPASGTIGHESALYVMKDGAVGRKIAGYDLKESDLDLSQPRGKFFDFKQFCSSFDPSRSRYGNLVMKALSMSSVLFLVFAVGGWMKLRRKKKC
jgi:cytochrome oxidase Cu insertion factor (SCO1/SenC/PrrC family)